MPQDPEFKAGAEPGLYSERHTSMIMLPHASALSRWLLPGSACAGVVAVVVAVVLGMSASRGGHVVTQPPVLHLVSVAGVSRGLSAAVAADTSGSDDATGSIPGGPGPGWRLEGKLPEGPSSGQVHLLAGGATTRDFVSALARSLAMSGQP
jgi:hypothetical protein